MAHLLSFIQQSKSKQAEEELSEELSKGPRPPYEVLTAEGVAVHLSWDLKNPPERPKDGTWTRLICVSDTHCQIFPIPDGDVFLHAGDLSHTVSISMTYPNRSNLESESSLTFTTIQGRYKQLQPTIAWIKGLSHQYKVHVLCICLLW